MDVTIRCVSVYNIENDGKLVDKYNRKCDLVCGYDPQGLSVRIITDNGSAGGVLEKNGDEDCFEFPISSQTDTARFGERGQVLNLGDESICVKFKTDADARIFRQAIDNVKGRRANSVFSLRTEESSASQYFQFYGYLSQQQNMMQDFVRTSTYQKAIHGNLSDFHNKIILDVGAGSGILSFFAVQAGAQKVYAVEASNMAQYAQQLVSANNLQDKIIVIAGKIEEIEIPQSVDVVISEPMGYMLYNERMLETYLHAKKWLKPHGKMFPSRGDLHVAPFTDEALYMEQFNKANFWYQTSFHGVDLSSMRTAAMKEYFRQPIVDTFDIRICMSKSVRHVVDFHTADETDLHHICIPLEFHMLETGTCHGLAFWFDVAFLGTTQQVWLSTSPTEPLTHWYQVRCLLQNPLFVKHGQLLTGRVLLVANKRQSYDVTMDLRIEGTSISSQNTLDLKNPYFRYTGAPVAAPPGTSTSSPSETYWTQLDAQGARNAVNMVNGISVNGLGEVSMDMTQAMVNNNLMGIGNNQPNIHPGCISSTGRAQQNSFNSISSGAVVNSIGTIISNNLNNSNNNTNNSYAPNMSGLNIVGGGGNGTGVAGGNIGCVNTGGGGSGGGGGGNSGASSSGSSVAAAFGGSCTNNFLMTSGQNLAQQQLIGGAIYRPK